VVERASVAQHVQIGVESVSGTAVAASKQLRSIGFTPSPKITVQQFRPQGQKYDSLAILGEEWVEAGVTGNAVYDELIYPLSSVLGAAIVTTGSGTTGALQSGTNQWVFSPQVSNPDAVKTFTVQHGDPSTIADQFSFGTVTDLQFAVDRTKFDVTGTMLGQRLLSPITFTPAPTLLPLVPIVPSSLTVFADTTAAGMGQTKLGRVLTYNWTMASKMGPLWAIDATQLSWAALVELAPTLSCTMLMEADTTGMGFLATVRAGATTYVRITSSGPNIGTTTTPYSFTLDMPVKIINTNGFSDSSGVYAIEWEFVGVYDSTFNAGNGGSMLLTLVNSLATL
jgi:hypothetical protein